MSFVNRRKLTSFQLLENKQEEIHGPTLVRDCCLSEEVLISLGRSRRARFKKLDSNLEALDGALAEAYKGPLS